jgi:hypothetical protein
MSPVAQIVSPVSSVSEIVREEIIALLADTRDTSPGGGDVRLGMDPIEIGQERVVSDEIDILRISPAIPLDA